MRKIYALLSLRKGEGRLLLASAGFIFTLFASYALLRPIRDALGLHGGADELKWLFAATFGATLAGSLAAMWLSGSVRRRLYVDVIFAFFALNLLGFWAAMRIYPEGSDGYAVLCRVFYVWVSVFNLFVISSAWSVLADVFSKDASRRLFGVVSAGASVGSAVGAGFVSFARGVDTSAFIFAAVLGLALALKLKNHVIALGAELAEREAVSNLNANSNLNINSTAAAREEYERRFAAPLPSKNPLEGFKIIVKSRYLLDFTLFMLLLTSVSTFLYMEQARVVSATFASREERVSAFATIDLVVQSASLFIQIFLTAKIAQFCGLKWLLSLLGFALAGAFILLAFTHPAFLPLAIVMSARRIGEYALVKPAREMLFVPLDGESKYKVKNFLDTVVYRGGDALSAQLEGALFKFGAGATLVGGAVVCALWGWVGLRLSKKYEEIK